MTSKRTATTYEIKGNPLNPLLIIYVGLIC